MIFIRMNRTTLSVESTEKIILSIIIFLVHALTIYTDTLAAGCRL